MLVVLEGCDGSGKSTIAKKLSMILNADIIHCSKETPNTMEFFSDIVEASKTRNIIADRFCYGQFIYQDSDNRPLGSYKNLNALEAKMLGAGAKVIFVDAPEEEIHQRLLDRNEKLINNLSIHEVVEKFHTLFSEISILSNGIVYWNTGRIR